MKKLLTVSVLAMMAVSAANAEIASKGYVDSGDGHYVTAANTAGQNIKALDDQVYVNTGKLVLPEGKSTVAAAIEDAITTAGSNQVQANWTEANTESKAYIQNKPTLGTLAAKNEVAKSDLASALASEIEGKANTADLGALASKDTVAKTDLAQDVQGSLNAADAALPAATYASEIGTVPSGKTVVGMISEAQTASVAGLDLTTVGGNGDVVLTVAQSDGQLSATAGKIGDANIASDAAIAKSKLASDVQTSLGKADTAQQPATTLAGYGIADAYTKTETDGLLDAKADASDLGSLAALSEVAESNLATTLATKINGKEDASNKVTSMSASSTDTQYPSAKAVYDAIATAQSAATYDDTALKGRVSANETAIGDANSGLTKAVADNAAAIALKQDASKSTVASAGNYIAAGDGVAANLGTLDTNLKSVSDVAAAAIPAPTNDCANPTNKCVLTSAGEGNYAWEVIARGNE